MVERLFDGQNYIYDRTTLIDDFVYQFLNQQPSTLKQYHKLILAILSHCHIFHLELDEQTQIERLQQRGDQYITSDMLDQINANYKDFYDDLHWINKITLVPDNEQNVDKIMEVINEN